MLNTPEQKIFNALSIEKEIKMKQKIKKGVLFILLAGTVITGCFFFSPVKVDEEARIIEFGETVSKDSASYVEGNMISGLFCKTDFSAVDETRPGEYEITVHHGLQKFHIPLIIKDTKAPLIVKKEECSCYELGTVLQAEDLISHVEDRDSEIRLIIKIGGKEQKELTCDRTGKWSVLLEAVDSSGNRSDETVYFLVDTAPEFYGIQDIYVAKGYDNFSYRDGIKVKDQTDGDLTESIQVTDDSVCLNQAGEYRVIYQATDSSGLTAEASAPVYVLEKEELEEKIGDRDINWREEKIFGAENRYDAGASVTDTLDEQLQFLLPTAVHLYFEYPDNPNIINSSASGFILYMDESDLYICTNYHVISEGGRGNCYFYTGENANFETAGFSKESDIAILKVDRASLAEETDKNLMSVHLNRDEFELAKNGGKPVFIQKLDKQGREYYQTGKTLSFGEIPFRLLPGKKTMASRLETSYGSSGSAMMDYEGNLIGMVSGFEDYKEGRIFHQIGMEDIIEEFSNITGINLYSE